MKYFLLLIFLIIPILVLKEKYKMNNSELKIAYNVFEEAKYLDPAKIETLSQANLIENLYSRLVDYDSNGQLICVLCKSFELKNDKIIFSIPINIKTIDGYAITAKDAEFSLRRIFDLNTNTHGSMTNFIANRSDINAIENSLEIKLIFSKYSEFVLPLLASMDFSIVPMNKIDKNNNIIDHRNTSGAYYLFKDDKDGAYELRANPTHPNFSTKMYQKIKIIPTNPNETINKFLHHEVDVIDVTSYPRTNVYAPLFKQEKVKFNSHQTIPINLFLLSTSKRTINNFSKEQLLFAYNLVAEKYLEFETYGYGFQRSLEFFPNVGNGHLSIEQIDILKKQRIITTAPIFKKPITLGVLERSYDKVVEKFKNYPQIKIISFKTEPLLLPEDQRPDILIQTTDSSFNEDISLLSYNFSMGLFGKSKIEGEAWIKDYIYTEKKENRIKKLQQLHFDLIDQGIVYPVGFSPYWAISTEMIELNFPKVYPGSHWWKIRQK